MFWKRCANTACHVLSSVMERLWIARNGVNVETITWDEFIKVELRVGKVISAKSFPEARKPAYFLEVDFGEELGIKKSSAQITKLYKREDLVGKQVIAVVNFPPKHIASFVSECLVLGVIADNKEIVLLQPERKVENGLRIA